MISDRKTLDEMRQHRRVQFNGVCPTRTIRTWVPEKYLLIDTETGDQWEFRLQPSGEITTRRASGESISQAHQGSPQGR